MKKSEMLAELTRGDRNPYGLAIALMKRRSSGVNAVIALARNAESAFPDGYSVNLALPGFGEIGVSLKKILAFRMLSPEEMAIVKVRRWLDRVPPDAYLPTLETYLHTAYLRDTYSNVFEWFEHPSREDELIRGALSASRLTIIVMGGHIRKRTEICLFADGVGAVTLSAGDADGLTRDVPLWLRKETGRATKALGNNLVRDWEAIPIQKWSNRLKKSIRVVIYDTGDTPIGIVRVAERMFVPSR